MKKSTAFAYVSFAASVLVDITRGEKALNGAELCEQAVSVAPPAEPRGEKKLIFVQILGGEKLFKIW